MKNPFALMAVMAAAMTAAFRENAYRDAGVALPTGGGRSRLPGKTNPAGTKIIRRFYKAQHGHKAESAQEAWAWYRGYLAQEDAKVRQRDAAQRSDRRATIKLAA